MKEDILDIIDLKLGGKYPSAQDSNISAPFKTRMSLTCHIGHIRLLASLDTTSQEVVNSPDVTITIIPFHQQTNPPVTRPKDL